MKEWYARTNRRCTHGKRLDRQACLVPGNTWPGKSNVPKELDWDLWLGTAPYKEYVDKLVPLTGVVGGLRYRSSGVI
jgi:hypothetical protein